MSDELFLLTEGNSTTIDNLDDENQKRAKELLNEEFEEKEEND